MNSIRIAKQLVKLAKELNASETRTISEYLTDLGWKIDGEIASKEIGADGVFVNVNVKDHACSDCGECNGSCANG